MSVLIYKIDGSKLIPIGQPGYQKGQEQAKIYLDEVPKDEFTVAVTDPWLIQRIGSLANVDLGGNHRILIGVNNRNPELVGLDITYMDGHSGTAKASVVSYANCPQESDYGLSHKLLSIIEEAFYAQKGKPLADMISDAAQRCAQSGNEKEAYALEDAKLM